MTKDDGGPVYPQDCQADPNKPPRIFGGITRRDWLAGMAMQGELAAETEDNHWESDANLATRCYRMADAIIAEGRKQ